MIFSRFAPNPLDRRLLLIILLCWAPLAAGLCVVCLVVYAAAQQDIRHAANDPQIELAESAARQLEGGAPPQSVLPLDSVDPSKSLAPFTIVYDSSGGVRSSSVSLHGQTPALPSRLLKGLDGKRQQAGIFALPAWIATALLRGKAHGLLGSMQRPGERRFTWQPEPEVRLASVLVEYDGANPGFVLAGRSLREVERLENHILFICAAGLAAGLAATLVLTAAAIAAARRLALLKLDPDSALRLSP
jgi:hypothetical protein